MEYTNISDNTVNNTVQAEYVIKKEVLYENEIKYEFVDEIVKEEPEDNYGIIVIKSELQTDEFLNDTEKNEEPTSKTGGRSTNECTECHKSLKCSVHLSTLSHTGDKAFNHSRLSRHNRIRRDTKRYKCDVCDKAFNKNFRLKIHKRCHTGEKPYKCDICDKAFTDSSSFKVHKRCHTGEKPYKCDVCDKAFTLSSSLKVHKLCHTGVKPYKCDVCDKAFNFQSSLNKHKRIHTSEKPYICAVCDKAFKQNATLIIHKRCHTGENPHKCNVCDKAFLHNFSLVKHKRCHDEEENNDTLENALKMANIQSAITRLHLVEMG